MRSDNLHELPPDLPVPGDDGAADDLTGVAVPDFGLMSTNGRIEKVFYPVFPPNRNAAEVVAWLETHPL